MTLFDLAHQLPNGFHDAIVRRIAIDYIARSASIELSVWMGNMQSEDSAQRELYQEARLTLIALDYFITDPPDARYPFLSAEGIRIDLCEKEQTPRLHLPTSSPSFQCAFFVNEWNSFIHISAGDVHFSVTAEPRMELKR